MSPQRYAAGAFLLSCFWLHSAQPDARFTLVETGAVWHYLDPGHAPNAGWTEVEFDEQGWKTGRAPFGYGRGNEATVLNYGLNPNTKPITSYFRYTFDLDDPSLIGRLTLRLFRDDAAVVYMNGHEVWRSNLQSFGAVTPDTPSTNRVVGLDGVHPVPLEAWVGALTNRNVLAVELHQFSPDDPDAWFDMPAIANLPIGLPIIQWISPTNGSILPFEDLELNVAVFDDDSAVWRVEYYSNGKLLGISEREPFDLNWYDPPAGRYSLRAEAIDFTGRRGITESVTVQVGEALPDRVIRGPYLQSATPESVVIRWRTDWFTAGRVWYGTDARELLHVIDSPALTTEHEITVRGLTSATQYDYAVGTPDQKLSYGLDHFFITSPTTAQPTRIWAIGDSGKTNQAARDVYQSYLRSMDRHTDIWLMLGDNAYESGTDDQYQKAVFELYSALLPNTVLWPTIGNHDQATVDQLGRIPYLDIFTLPRTGEAGGVSSGTERYYSFDHGQVHFICLDSSGSSRLPGSPMLQWLESDLGATSAEWLIAFWHHPPYTFGSHNSDIEYDLMEMRQNVLPILEAYGVDLVLSGHSHNYERSYLLQGHYGSSTNLHEEMIIDFGSGNPEVDHSYQKPAEGLRPGLGTVYAVCGCSGEGGAVEVRLHPAMYRALGGYGSLVIDVDGLRLKARLISEIGAVRDAFVIDKDDPSIDEGPLLRIRHTAAGVELSWPAWAVAYHLEVSAGATIPWGWQRWQDTPNQVGGRYVLLLNDPANRHFFRLHAD